MLGDTCNTQTVNTVLPKKNDVMALRDFAHTCTRYNRCARKGVTCGDVPFLTTPGDGV